jgi:hypothetical protein
MEIGMNNDVRDTSADYEDLVGYKAKENVKSDLSLLLDEEVDTKPDIWVRPVNPDFPERWQSVYVNFRSFEDYVAFMKIVDEAPVPKLTSFEFKKEKDDGLLKFLGD